ncbi:Tn3 family transposase [Streptomyces sp. NPDC014734]|uniref:Tn3 family transposase n=1 Tax=Streptomyces sp. NPDC014734 TaxID=3364886 RepID=UPI0037001070
MARPSPSPAPHPGQRSTAAAPADVRWQPRSGDLLPRIKQINKVKLYRPGREDEDTYERLADAMTRPIRWDVSKNNYDQLIKYATAIRVGTASTEAILRRFTRTASHPVYQAMLEVGKAPKTIFVARYLRDRDLQREIQEGLNVVEGWNGANDIIFSGKSGELSSNRCDQQELSALALHLLQTALVFVFSELPRTGMPPPCGTCSTGCSASFTTACDTASHFDEEQAFARL